MALTALSGTPIVPIGAAHRFGNTGIAALGTTTIDAANEACIMYGHVFTSDGASHTINTTGSSSLGWRSGALTFANAGTTVKVGLAALDTATGPPARAANAAGVITFDVSKSHTGGGGTITANAWQENVPDTGTKTIANGDLVAFCVQATARAGSDIIRPSAANNIGPIAFPGVTDFVGAAYASAIRTPNAVITFSDGALGFFYGGFVASVGSTTQTWNNTSGTKEYGNLLQFTFPVNVYGLYFSGVASGDVDAILYSDPLGTPVAQKTSSVDLNVISTAAADTEFRVLFASPFTLAADTACAAILKPTSATNISMNYKTFNASSHQASEMPGTAGYAVNRNAGAFAAQNTNKDRFAIGLLVGAFDNGASTSPVSKLISAQRGAPY